MNWKIISFYTADYADEVAILKASLEKFNLPHDIELVSNKGNWKENAFYKIPFIIKKLKQYKHPLVWLDADAEVLQYPIEFDNLEGILMAGIYSPLNPPEYVSNTIYLTPSEDVFQFLTEVQNFIKAVPNAYDRKLVGEQFYMQKVLESNDWKGRLKFKVLPYSYGLPSYWGKLTDRKLDKCYKEAPVISQRQASRRKNPEKRVLYKQHGFNIND